MFKEKIVFITTFYIYLVGFDFFFLNEYSVVIQGYGGNRGVFTK